MQSSSDVEEFLIHPSVTLAVIERADNGKYTSGKDMIPSLGRVHATAAHPYTLRLRNRNTSTAIVFRVTTKNAHWWWAHGTHGVLHPPDEEANNSGTGSTSTSGGGSKVIHHLGDGNRSVAYVSLRIKEPERLDHLYKEWSALSHPKVSVETMNAKRSITSDDYPEEGSELEIESEGATENIATTILSSSSSPPPLPSSYVSGKTTTAVDFIRIVFAELPATHPLLHSLQRVVDDPNKPDFLTWWNRVTTVVAASNRDRGKKRWRWKRTPQVYTGVTDFTLPVKVAFLSEKRFWAAIAVRTRGALRDSSNTGPLLPSQGSLSFSADGPQKQGRFQTAAELHDDDRYGSHVGLCTLLLAVVAVICSFLAGLGLVQ